MINPEVDKNIMPDGSAHMGGDILPASDVILPTSVNGEAQGSPVEAPESPEDKGIIRCTCHFFLYLYILESTNIGKQVSVVLMRMMDSPFSAIDVRYGNMVLA